MDDYNVELYREVLDDRTIETGSDEILTFFTIRNEADNLLKNERGTIAMARQPDVVDSSTSQFFFNLADNPALDHQSADDPTKFGYCVFGKVTQGIEVLEKISRIPVTNRDNMVSVPTELVKIKSVTPLD